MSFLQKYGKYPFRHSGEGRNPVVFGNCDNQWTPVFTGVTTFTSSSIFRNFLLMCLLLCLLTLIEGCGKKAPLPPPPPPPAPSLVEIEIETSGDINPNPEGRPSPLSLRIYQLKSLSDFNNADFMTLYKKDDSVLGVNLTAKEEILLKSNDKRKISYETSDETRAIAFFAVFRDYEQAQWKAIAPVTAHKLTQIQVIVSGTSITVK